MMAGIRGTDTRPELKIRKALHAKGLRYRLHDKTLPGKPDLVFKSRKAIIMIHGCFWHGHDCHLFKWPSTRPDFWRTKIDRNREKDAEVLRKLDALGFRVLAVWECAIKGKTRLDFDFVVDEIERWVLNGKGNLIIRGQ